MSVSKALFSSNSDEWSTPQALFDKLDQEFCFDLDVCANEENHKCEQYFTIADDGLSMSWAGHRVWCNPPYSQIARWVKKCYEESRNENTLIALLIPSRTDTKYFQDYIYNRSELRFIRGRLKFGDSKGDAPFPNVLVIFRGPKVR